ncbi:MAG: ABC transporter permease [Brevundimonas sp.]|uniref:ABC transporter permease n=1 Tax=Brevundimonas sp. TaxID=1871086 RepID=UPI00391B0054
MKRQPVFAGAARILNFPPALLPGGPGWLSMTMVALMVMLSALALAGTLAAHDASSARAALLGREVSVLVRPRVDESPERAAVRAAETLAGAPGVDEAAALTRDEAERLLRPWLAGVEIDDVALPPLVSVRLSQDSPATASGLSRLLASAGIDATVEDHGLWRSEAEAAALRLVILLGALSALLFCAMVAAVLLVVRGAVSGWRASAAIFALTGAAPGWIVARMQGRVLRIVAPACLIGAVGASALTGLAGLLLGTSAPVLAFGAGTHVLIGAVALFSLSLAVVSVRLIDGGRRPGA